MSYANAIKGKIALGRKQIPEYADDDFWRDTLEDLIGVRSLSGFTDEKKLGRVVDFLASKGAVFTKPAGAGKYRAKAAQRRTDFYAIPDGPNARQKRYICALWKELGYDMTALDTRVKRQIGVDAFRWVDDVAFLQTLGKDLANRVKRKKAKDQAA